MTVFTLATVGYGELHPLGRRGRMFTMCLILMDVIGISFIVNRFTEALIQGYFQGKCWNFLGTIIMQQSPKYLFH